LSFAHHVGLPLQQLYGLAVEAAGGSAMFKEFGPKLIPILEGNASSDEDLSSVLTNLKKAIEKAQEMKCPLYLGNGALNQLLASGKETKLSGLVNLYNVR
jgi:3-hydroxyisobutyrate dehydrogenase